MKIERLENSISCEVCSLKRRKRNLKECRATHLIQIDRKEIMNLPSMYRGAIPEYGLHLCTYHHIKLMKNPEVVWMLL